MNASGRAAFTCCGRFGREAGITLTEMLVTLVIFTVVGSIVFSLYNSSAKLISADQGRVNTNQNLRTSLDLMTQDLRQAGESLSTQYSISGVDFAPATGLTVRKGVTLPVLSVCQTFNGAVSSILVTGQPSDSSTIPAQCSYSDAGGPVSPTTPNGITDKVDPWMTYQAQAGHATIPAILYNPVTKLVSRVVINGVTNTAVGGVLTSTLNLVSNVNATAFSWSSGSVVVPVDERRYYLVADELRFIANEDPATIQALGYGLSAMTFTATTVVGAAPPVTTVYPTFAIDSPWKSVSRVDLSLSGSNTVTGSRAVARTLSVSVYPRNVLQSR